MNLILMNLSLKKVCKYYRYFIILIKINWNLAKIRNKRRSSEVIFEVLNSDPDFKSDITNKNVNRIERRQSLTAIDILRRAEI